MKKQRLFFSMVIVIITYSIIMSVYAKTMESKLMLTSLLTLLLVYLIDFNIKEMKEKARKEKILSFEKSYEKFAVKKKNSD